MPRNEHLVRVLVLDGDLPRRQWVLTQRLALRPSVRTQVRDDVRQPQRKDLAHRWQPGNFFEEHVGELAIERAQLLHHRAEAPEQLLRIPALGASEVSEGVLAERPPPVQASTHTA